MKCLLLFCVPVLFAADIESLVKQAAAYDYGKDPSAVRELEALVQRSGTSLDKPLLAGLAAAQTLAAKDIFCRQLAIAGSDVAVPALAPMLLANDTADMARDALERIPGSRSLAALRDALSHTTPPVQTGIVVSLGRRKDTASDEAIGQLLASKDTRLAAAAAAALARIATPAARDSLVAASRTPAVTDALLAIAEQSDSADAVSIYRGLGSEGLAGLARVDPARAAPLLHTALKGDSPRLQAIAIRELARIEGLALAKEMPNVSERARIRILQALADTSKPEVRPVLVTAAASDSGAVRASALGALAKLGTAAEVNLLASRAAADAGDEQSAARAALGAIRGEAVDAAILEAIPAAEPKMKVELIRAAGERGIARSPEVLLAAAADPNQPVRIESIRALRETAGPPQVAPLLALLAKSATETERRELERTLATAIRRSPEAGVDDVLAAYRNSSEVPARVSLLNVLSAVGNPAALPVVRAGLQDSSAEIQRAALNALAGWPTPEPLDDLLALTRNAADPARQILALRGYIKLVQLPSGRPPAETARLLKAALDAATRPDEKRAVLAIAQRLVCPESLELARTAAKDPQVAAEAQLAVTTLERGLSFLRK